ncbi:MAG: hypothetical protein A2Z38_02795 [Planctomycetes bacterium RBG_19FT_COMBO_48_8]|nr:MAG: hypothetical protein A2Z38_02795 [Planctomycetes bacterium RBG_19FT_COMBO_48_8]
MHPVEFVIICRQGYRKIKGRQLRRRLFQFRQILRQPLELMAPGFESQVGLDQTGKQADISRFGRVGKWPGQPSIGQ